MGPKHIPQKEKKNTINGRFPYGHFSINNLYIFVWIYHDCSTMISVYGPKHSTCIIKRLWWVLYIAVKQTDKVPTSWRGSGVGST